MADVKSQRRMLRLFRNIENSWQEWIDRKHLKIVQDGIKMTNATTFTLPYDSSKKTKVYGAFAAGK